MRIERDARWFWGATWDTWQKFRPHERDQIKGNGRSKNVSIIKKRAEKSCKKSKLTAKYLGRKLHNLIEYLDLSGPWIGENYDTKSISLTANAKNSWNISRISKKPQYEIREKSWSQLRAKTSRIWVSFWRREKSPNQRFRSRIQIKISQSKLDV